MDAIIDTIKGLFEGGFDFTVITDFFAGLAEKYPQLQTIIDTITGLIGQIGG